MRESPSIRWYNGFIPVMKPRKNPSGAGNVQGSPTEAELAWLAGIFDGEGWIGVNRSIRKTTGKHRYSAGSVVATTSERLAVRIHDLLTKMSVSFFDIEVEAKMGSDGSWRRRKWNISVVGNIQTEKFLRAIQPFLVEKEVQAKLVLEYIEKRAELPHRPGGHNLTVNQEIRDLGEHYQGLLREDRHRDDPSTTTRLAPAKAG
jgi:intein/homing endonuclease